MSDRGYEILSLDDLERAAVDRRRADAAAAAPHSRLPSVRRQRWLGATAGDHVIERHHERDGDEELYVVVRGRATFTRRRRDVRRAGRARSSTSPPGTLREAIADEDDTLVLAVGAKPGKAWEPAAWEDFYRRVRASRRGPRRRGARTVARHARAPSGHVAGRVQRSRASKRSTGDATRRSRICGAALELRAAT